MAGMVTSHGIVVDEASSAGAPDSWAHVDQLRVVADNTMAGEENCGAVICVGVGGETLVHAGSESA
jgi:hypothetical protein